MGYDPDACILARARPLHAGGHAVLGAPRDEAAARYRPDVGAAPGSTPRRALRRLSLRLPDGRDLRAVPRGRAAATSGHSSKVKSTCTFCGVGCQIDLNVDPADEPHRQGHVRPSTSRTRATSASRAASPSTSSTTRTGSRSRSSAARTASCTRRPGSTRSRSPRPACAGSSSEHGPQSVGFLASARLTKEENYLIQKLARTAVGTNSVHSCEST